jgi:hypothetical protein
VVSFLLKKHTSPTVYKNLSLLLLFIHTLHCTRMSLSILVFYYHTLAVALSEVVLQLNEGSAITLHMSCHYTTASDSCTFCYCLPNIPPDVSSLRFSLTSSNDLQYCVEN